MTGRHVIFKPGNTSPWGHSWARALLPLFRPGWSPWKRWLPSERDLQEGGIELTLEVYLRTARMREAGTDSVLLGRSNMWHLYWTVAQLLTHHASNGCNLQAGDLLASGTVSGPEHEARGSLLELTRNGREVISLPAGEKRGFLKDGDEVIIRGYCERPGWVGVGLGECSGI